MAYEVVLGVTDQTLAAARADAAPDLDVLVGDVHGGDFLGSVQLHCTVMLPTGRGFRGICWLVALEAMPAGAPVVAFDIDNLPDLIDGGGSIVPREDGHLGLWRAAGDLLADPIRYEQTSRAGYDQARNYRPAHIADLLVKVVS